MSAGSATASDHGRRGARSRMTATGGLMVLAAVTLAIASTIHSGVAIFGVTARFDGARGPEAIIAVVVMLGALAAFAGRGWIALGTLLFGLLGVIVGLRFTLMAGPSGDLVYHFSLLALLLVTLGVHLTALRRDLP